MWVKNKQNQRSAWHRLNLGYLQTPTEDAGRWNWGSTPRAMAELRCECGAWMQFKMTGLHSALGYKDRKGKRTQDWVPQCSDISKSGRRVGIPHGDWVRHDLLWVVFLTSSFPKFWVRLWFYRSLCLSTIAFIKLHHQYFTLDSTFIL